MRQTALLLLAGMAVAFAGCATGGTRAVDLTYTPAPRPSTSGAGAPIRTVAVATFVDARSAGDRIGVLKERSGDTVFVARGSLPEAVTEAVARRLAADGYEVSRLGSAWDPRSGSIPSASADVVVGGVIESFFGEADANYVWSPVNADLRLRVAVASPKQGRIVGESLIRSELGGTTTSRSLEASLKERFRAAIEQVPLVQGLERSMTTTAK